MPSVYGNVCVSTELIAGNGSRASHQNGTQVHLKSRRQWYESRKNVRMDYAEIKAFIRLLSDIKGAKVYEQALFMQRIIVCTIITMNVQRLASDGGGESLNVKPQASES